MNSLVSLQQSTIQEVLMLFDNENALRKVLSFTKKLRQEEAEKSEELTAKEKKEVLSDIREALIEVKLAKEGKAKLSTWKDFKHEIHD